jgi:predicted DNA-binding protein with PD1-like motif
MRQPIENSTTRIEGILVVRIDPGQDLQKSIETIAERERVSAGVILSIVGSLRKAKLRNVKSYPTEFPVSDRERAYHDIEGPLEILNVSGNICRRVDNALHVHLHATLSKIIDGRIVVLGGHIGEGCETFVMVEAFIGILGERSFTRAMHPERRSWEVCLPQSCCGKQ